jgi:hypothetical protein
MFYDDFRVSFTVPSNLLWNRALAAIIACIGDSSSMVASSVHSGVFVVSTCQIFMSSCDAPGAVIVVTWS